MDEETRDERSTQNKRMGMDGGRGERDKAINRKVSNWKRRGDKTKGEGKMEKTNKEDIDSRREGKGMSKKIKVRGKRRREHKRNGRLGRKKGRAGKRE